MSSSPLAAPLTRAEASSAKAILIKVLDRLGPLLGLILVVVLFAALTRRTFLTVDNIVVILQSMTVIAVASLGMTVIIISGGIDLSVGSQIALSCVLIPTLWNYGCPPAVAAIGGILASTLVGAVIGALITGLRISPFIATLGTLSMLRGAAIGAAHETMVYPPDGAPTDIWLMKLLLPPSGSIRWIVLPPAVWLLVIFSLITAAMLRYTRFGRQVFAIGSNEQTATLCGIPVPRTKILIYLIGGLTAGIAGVFQFSYLTGGDPNTATGLELNIIAAVVIGGASLSGGQGTVLGTLVGALIMSVIANGCSKIGLSNWVQMIVTGGIIIIAVALDRFRRTAST